MARWIISAILAGAASAALQAMFLSPSLITALLVYLSPLPLFLTGFSYGPTSTVLASLVGAAISMLIFSGFWPPIIYLLTAALAPIVISRLALLNRPAGGVHNEGETSIGDVLWYPEGRMVLWLAAIASLAVALTILSIGTDIKAYHEFLASIAKETFTAIESQMPAGQEFPKEQFVSLLVKMMPVVAAALWLMSSVLNMRLAIAILSKQQKLLRPWADFGRMTFPKNSVFVLFITMIAAYFLPGIAGLMALGAAGAFASAFIVSGLSVVHGLLAKHPARTLFLTVLYAMLLIFNWLIALPLILLALFDANGNIRKNNNQTTE